MYINKIVSKNLRFVKTKYVHTTLPSTVLEPSYPSGRREANRGKKGAGSAPPCLRRLQFKATDMMAPYPELLKLPKIAFDNGVKKLKIKKK